MENNKKITIEELFRDACKSIKSNMNWTTWYRQQLATRDFGDADPQLVAYKLSMIYICAKEACYMGDTENV